MLMDKWRQNTLLSPSWRSTARRYAYCAGKKRGLYFREKSHQSWKKI